MACYNFSHFGKYFEENMSALGLPAPSSVFSSAAGAAAGSAAVAIGRSLGCGATITDAIVQLQNHSVNSIWLESELRSNSNFVHPIR